MRLKKVPGALENVKLSKYYVDEPEKYKGKWNNVFKNENPIHIEIGMGKGHFIVGMAKQNPTINYIGIEMYDSVLCRATELLEAEEAFLPNIKLLLLDANNINDVFAAEIDRIYLNFSDPWPKARHAKRRLTSENFLCKYDTIFKGSKNIFMKTDNDDLFEFSVESLTNHGYALYDVTNDLHSLNEEDNVMTEYEAKFAKQGVKINRLKSLM